MINLTNVLVAVETALAGVSATVERGERINFDPARCPWVGIYPGELETAPKTLGGAGAQRWQTTGNIQVVCQTSSFTDDGQAASEALESLIEEVVGAIFGGDLTLGLAGVRVVGLSREYRYVVFDEDEGGSIFFPQVVLRIRLDVRSS